MISAWLWFISLMTPSAWKTKCGVIYDRNCDKVKHADIWNMHVDACVAKTSRAEKQRDLSPLAFVSPSCNQLCLHEDAGSSRVGKRAAQLQFYGSLIIVWSWLKLPLAGSSLSSCGRWLTRANTQPAMVLFPVGKSPGNCQQTSPHIYNPFHTQTRLSTIR